MTKRKIIVHIAASADGFIARPDGDLEWLTSRPAPKGFYGLSTVMNSIDAKIFGRKTYDASIRLGAKFGSTTANYVFSRSPPVQPVPEGVQFVSEAIGPFAERLRAADGKDIWMMGGGDLIASFLDAGAIDEFIITVMPVFIGDGIPLLAPRHREVPLELAGVRSFEDGVVQLHYETSSG